MNKKIRFSLLTLLVMLCGTVFADNIKATLTGTNMVVSGVSATSYSDYLTTGLTDDKGNVYYGRWCHQKSGSNYMNMLQIKKTESNTATRINLPKYPGNLKKITLTVTNANSTSTTDGTGAKTRLAIINSTTYNTATATNTDNQVLVAGSSSDENTSYVFDFTTLEESYDGEGLYLCSLDGAARIWSLEAEYATAATPDPTPAPTPYAVDFNTSITTSVHDFVVASNWGHIVDFLEYDYYGSEYSYVSYGYSSTGGKNETGALYAYSQNLSASYGVSASKTAYDLLVTPLVKGQISIDVKAMDYADASLQVYALTNNGKEKGDLIKEFVLSDLSKDEYTTVTFTLAEEQKVGLRLNRVYVDNFSAESATIVPEPKLTITSVKKATDDGTVYYKQQADGSLLVQMYVKLQNNGEVDFVAGTTENYTLSVIQDYYGTKAGPFGAFAIPVNLAKGETSDDILVSVNVPAESVASLRTWGNWYVIENITSTQSSNYVYASWTAYEPKFVFRLAESSSTSSISSAESWGTITESTTKNFEIANTGTAPLTIKSITLPEGFTCSNMPEIPTEGLVIASNASQALTITQPATAYGTYAGNLTIVYLDKTGAEQTYTLAFSASYINPNTWTADFNNTTSTVKYPAGVIAEGGIDKDYQYISSDNYNNWIIGRTTSSYASGSNKFITPKLHAAAGDKLTFDVKGAYGDSYYAKVYVSTDRKTWGDSVAYFTYGEKEGAEAIGSSEWKTRTITFAEAGDYYVAFALYGKFAIDNIVGLEKVNVAHDLYIKEVSWPNAKEKSGTALSKPSVDIIPLTDETADAYTVKYVCGETVLAEGTPVALTASANSSKTFSFSWTPTVESTTAYPGTKVVFEFTDGTKFETEPFDLTITNEAIFHFLDSKPSSKWYEPTDRTAPIAFGKLNGAATPKSFIIFNWGSADLTVNSISLPEGFTTETEFPFTVAAFNGENSGIDASSKALSINFTGTAAGTYSGNMVITYSGDKTFSLPISGTMLDATKFYANFGSSSDQWPAGSVYQSSVSTTYVNTGDYAITSSSTTNNIFVTPKLTAAAGDKLMFDAKLYSSSWSEGKVVVYAAATREEVLNAEEGTTRDSLFAVSGQDETNPMTTDYQTFEVTVPAAGDYFFGFQISGRPYVDEIYGLKAAAVAHDWMVASSNVPAEAMQNVASTATVNILNLGLAEEAADSYTVTAYVDGKAAGTGTAIALPIKNKLSDAGTQISVNFKSPKAGTFPVYIEVKAGDYSVKTAPVDVVFAEEVAIAEAIEIGSGSTTTYSYAPIDFYNFEQARTSDILYTSAQLTAFGLKSGDKITSLAFKGTLSSAKTLANSSLKAWVALSTGEITYNSPDKSSMTEIAIYNAGDMVFVSGTNMVTINLPEAITYDGTSDLRIYLEGGGNSEYVSLNFAYDTNYSNMKWSNATSMKYNPLLYVNLAAVEPATFSGTVKDAEGAAIEGATVTLISTDGANIQYTGKTNAEGAYSINVIQNLRNYTAIATAPGHTTATKTIIFGGESKTEDFVIVVPSTAILTNPGFELSDAVTTNWAAGSSANSADYESTGWKNTKSAAWSSSAIVAYGSKGQVNGASAPETDNEGNAGKALGISVGWNGLITYQSATIALPAGVYTLKVAAYNAHTETAFTSKLGFIPTEGNPYMSSKNSFASKEWVTDEVTFTLNEDTEGKFQIGGAAGNAGSGSHAKVFFDNLTLTYKSFFAAAIEDLQTEIAKAEALKTEARTEGLTEFNAAIEDAKALLTSTDATAINAIVETLKAAETAFLTANLPVAEGTYYVFNPMTQKFLSRGNAYGTAAVVDDYGVAVNVTVTDLTTASYKLSSFDNGAAYGFDAWMYADAGGNNVRTYNINKVERGVTLTNTTNNQLVYVYLNDGADKFRVAGNAIKDDNYTDDAQTVWQLVTKEERDIIVARHEATQKTTAFTAAGIAEDAKLEVAEPTLVSFTSGNAWTQTVVKTQDNQPATNANGTEMWQATGNYKQAIKKVPSGLYKVSIQAFYRNGGADECAARYATGYNTVLAYLEANGNKVQVKSWAADKGEGTNPNSMGEAKAKFDEGKYLSEVYTFVGEDSTLNLTVNNPAHIGNGWFIAGNVKYAKVDEFILAGDATLDGTVTTADAVAAVNFALEVETPSEKAFKAADVNKSNSITVSDAVGIVNIALEITPEAPARSDMEAVNFLTMNGNALELMNTTEFVGFQMDVTLANGAMLNGVSLAERAAGLQVVYNRIADNTYRIIAFSAGNAAIEGNEGELFSLDITGNANVNITNIEFADAAARAYALGFGETTGIRGIYAGATNVESYTVGGIKNDKVRKGMNVVRTADGKVKKVYVK